MQDRRCQHENPTHAKFCLECGARLVMTCAKCRTELPGSAKFCLECGEPVAQQVQARFNSPESYTPKHLAEKILTSKVALEGERKQVTVLFADLKGSMELLADRDPEEARKLLDPILEHMMEAVHRYEGTVNQVMGDGIMALFGAPLAHEDHAIRACYAALRMQETARQYAEGVRREYGVTIRIRVGLNSGEVVVRAIGSDLHMDYTAVGQTTHLAARMEQLADPGAILLTPDTLTLAEGFVQVTPLGPVPVRGLPAPVDIYELTGVSAVRSRLQAAATRGLSRFVGRAGEMDQLHRALEQARHGRGQVAAVVGEPGVGKSRLVFELTHSHRVAGWLVLEAGAVSYGKATSWLPLADVLRSYFRIGDHDTHRDIREKVTGKLLTLDRALEPTLPAVLALLDVPVEDSQWQGLDPAQRRQRTLEAIKRLLLRETQDQPLLLVFEDLHWIDTETQAILDSLVESLPTVRLLLLVNYRPEYRHTWGSKTHYTQLRLAPLPPESADELLDALLGRDGSLDSLKSLLAARTGRNPLFIEESVRALVETQVLSGERGAYRSVQPVDTIHVPATVQAILAARIDRLAPDEKRLLETAAVIGHDVPFALLQAIADEGEETLQQRLGRLQAAEFLYETRLFPHLEYTFKHALTHEVAYGNVLKDRRRALHAQIAAAIERLYANRLTEHIERLAYHTLMGGVWEPAVRYLRQAGSKAVERSALREAVTWFEHALTALSHLPEDRTTLQHAFDLRLELRHPVSNQGDLQQTLVHLRDAERLAEKLGDDRRRGRVYAFMVNSQNFLGDMGEALASGTRALEIGQRLGDLELRIVTTTYLEQTYVFLGEFQQAIDVARANLSVLPAEAVDERFGAAMPTSVFDRGWLAISLAQLGKFTEATEVAETSIQISERTHHPYSSGWAYSVAGQLHTDRGNWGTARGLFERAVDITREGQQVLQLPRVLAGSSLVLGRLGESGEARNRAEEAEELYEVARAGGRRGGWALVLTALCQSYLLLGRLADAERVVQRVPESRTAAWEAHAHHLEGEIAAHPDRWQPEMSGDRYRRALALAAGCGMRPLVAHCHFGLGKVYRRTGKRQEAHEHLTTATAMYREMEMTYWLEQAARERAALDDT